MSATPSELKCEDDQYYNSEEQKYTDEADYCNIEG